jgi:trehalose/maltose transport system substrate-binding protein
MIGRTLGIYRIVEQIGIGGMASVYKAYDPGTDRYVALKVLPETFARDPHFLARFEREAKAIARLEHPRILPVHAFGEQDGITYLVMRYLPGGTLAHRLLQGPLTLEQSSHILDQIADALDYAHRHGVLHRDVKPSNVLLDDDDNVYLTDFGIAKIVESTIDLTGSGGLLGTPAYMSPEQCMGVKDLTPATDIYSLGIVAYEMITGRAPFEAETPVALIHKHLNEPLPLPRTLRPDLPEAVERVLLKALAKEPENRYENCSAMAAAFAGALADYSAERAAPTLVEHAAPTMPEPIPASADDLTLPAGMAAETVDETATSDTAPAAVTPAVPVPRPARRRRGRPGLWIAGLLALLVIGGGLLGAALLGSGLPFGMGGNSGGSGEEPPAAAGQPAGPQDEQPQEPEAEAPLPADEEIVIRIAGSDQWPTNEATHAAAEAFERSHPRVHVEVAELGNMISTGKEEVFAALESGSPEFDIVQVNAHWVGQVAPHLVDLREFGLGDLAGTMFPRAVENNLVDERLVALPVTVGTGLLYVRADLLEKYGFDHPPRDWWELTEMAEIIQEGERAAGNPGFWGYIWQGANGSTVATNALEWQASATGRPYLLPGPEVDVLDPAWIELLDLARTWPGRISPPEVLEMSSTASQEIWLSGNAAFMRNWLLTYDAANQPDSPVAGLFRVALLPAGPAGRAAGTLSGYQMGVSRYSEHPRVAAEFVAFMLDYDQQRFRAVELGIPPSMMPLYEQEDVLSDNLLMRLMPEAMSTAIARPAAAAGVHYDEVEARYGEAVHAVLRGEADPREAMERLERDLYALFAEAE